MSLGLVKSIGLSSFVGLCQRGLQIGATLIVLPMVMNTLGPNSFGIWAAAASLTWMAATFDFGIGNALVTEVSRSFAANESERVRALFSTALFLGAGIAIFEIIGAFLLIPRVAPTEASDAYMIAAVFMALNVPVSFALSLWAGEQRLYVAWGWEAAQTVVIGVLMWLLATSTNDVRLYVALSAGGVLVTGCASMAHFLFTHPNLRPSPALPSFDCMKCLFGRGIPYLLLGLGTSLASYSDSIIALATFGGDGAAVMAISQRMCMTAQSLLLVLSQPLWPKFANAAVRQEVSWIKKNFSIASLIVISAALAGSILLILFGGKVVNLWLGDKLVLEPRILWAMAVWIMIPALGRVPDVLLNALGIVWFQVKVAFVFGVIAFALKIALSNSFGISGIIAATGIAYAFTHLPAYIWWIRRWMLQTESR